MSDQPPTADAANAATFREFTLDFDIKVGNRVAHAAGTTIRVRKPGAGELRGVTLMALSQLDYGALETITPRITTPTLQKHEIAVMDPADLMQLGGEVMDFLLPKAAKAEASQQA